MAVYYTQLLSITEFEKMHDVRTVRRLSNDSNDPNTRVDTNVEFALDTMAAFLRSKLERDYTWSQVIADTESVLVVKGWQGLLAICSMYQRREEIPQDLANHRQVLLESLDQKTFLLPVGKASKAIPARYPENPIMIMDEYAAKPFPYDPNYKDNTVEIP